MSKNMFLLIKNNLISIFIHVCLSFLFFVLFPLLYSIVSSIDIEIIEWFVIGASILISFYLYFLAGKKCLNDTHNTLTNIFSVIALVIILIYAIPATGESIWDDASNLPFKMLFEAMSFILQIPYGAAEAKYVLLALAPLPSLAMLAGLMVKQRRETLNQNESLSNEKPE